MGSTNERTNSRRACDGCRIRKVKCNGNSPCAQCGHLGLRCTYDRPSASRKPGIRNRIIKQLRQTNGREVVGSPPDEDGDAAAPPGGAATHHHTSSKPNNTSNARSPVKNRTYSSGEGDPFSPFAPQGNLEPNYTQGFFTSLIPDFEELVLPVQPISNADEIRAAIANMHDSLGDAALVYAFAAVTINQNRASWTSSLQDCAPRVIHLVRLCLRAHRQAQANSDSEVLSELPFTAKRVVTCVFMGTTLMALNRMDRSFTVLREGITLLQNITYGAPLHHTTELKKPEAEETRTHRLHWIMYIHERYLSLTWGYPTVMPEIDTAKLQSALDDLPAHVQVGFRALVSLFRIVDGAFLAAWISQRGSMSSFTATAHTSEVTTEWIQHKQTQLDEDEQRAIQDEQDLLDSGKGPLTEFQRVDLSITRLWLRTLLWQLALSQGLLTSVATPLSHRNHDGLLLHFPARRLSRQLGSLVRTIETVDSVSAHGCGILQKLFEITSSAADVLSLPSPGGNGSAARVDVTSPTGATESDADYVKDLVLSIYFLLGMNSVDNGKRQYLLAKLELLQERFPDVDFQGVGAEGAGRSLSTGQPSPVSYRT